MGEGDLQVAALLIQDDDIHLDDGQVAFICVCGCAFHISDISERSAAPNGFQHFQARVDLFISFLFQPLKSDVLLQELRKS